MSSWAGQNAFKKYSVTKCMYQNFFSICRLVLSFESRFLKWMKDTRESLANRYYYVETWYFIGEDMPRDDLPFNECVTEVTLWLNSSTYFPGLPLSIPPPLQGAFSNILLTFPVFPSRASRVLLLAHVSRCAKNTKFEVQTIRDVFLGFETIRAELSSIGSIRLHSCWGASFSKSWIVSEEWNSFEYSKKNSWKNLGIDAHFKILCSLQN